MGTAADVHDLESIPGGDPVLTVKLRVPSRRPTVARARLTERLSDAVRGPLTVVSAPAGSGKTVLAASWAAAKRAPGPVAWVSLDPTDDQPGVFWTYVVAALARAGVDLPGVGVPTRAERVDHSFVVRLTWVLSQRAAPVVLVLDNAHVLTHRGIRGDLDFLVRRAGPRLRTVLLSRTDPAVPLQQYRLDGSVTELRFTDLAFSDDEAAELVRGRDLDVGPAALAAFNRRARGWAAGLRLADAGTVAGADVPPGSDIGVYFRSEVLARVPPEWQDLLRTTGVMACLTPQLAAALCDSPLAADTLRALAQTEALVEPCPDHADCHRYQPLVRELLLAENGHEPLPRRRRLHRRVALQLSRAGRLGQSLTHYAAAGDWQSVSDSAVRGLYVADLLAAAPGDGVGAALTALPEATPGAAAAALRAALAWRSGALAGCDAHLARARELAGDTPSPALRLAVEVVESLLGAGTGDGARALRGATSVQELLSSPQGQALAAPPAVRALMLWTGGCAHLGAGDLPTARDVLAGAARAANVVGLEALRARCLGHLALAEALRGRLSKGGDTAHRALAIADAFPGAAAGLRVAALVALAWVGAQQGDKATTRAQAQAAAEALADEPDVIGAAVLDLVKVRLLRARGDLGSALGTARRARSAAGRGQVPPWLGGRLAAAEATVLAAQGRGADATTVLQETGAGALPEGALADGWAQLPAEPVAAMRAARRLTEQAVLPLDVRVEANVLAAAAQLECSRQDAARASLDSALALAEQERIRRPFDEMPPRLRALLRGRPDVQEGQLWATPSPHGRARSATTYRRSPCTAVTQPLTEREREVLTHLAALLPTEEIASQMFLSVNTVKTHVRAILRKLSAERRNDAVRRARELGLV